MDGTVKWSDTSGFIQETGRNVVEPGQTLTATTYLVVFHSDEPPKFARWSMDYEFAASPPADGVVSEATRQTAGAPFEPAPAATKFHPRETCAGKEVGSCWMETENQQGCYLWNPNLASNDETVTWSGECSAGLAQGPGARPWHYTDDDGNPTSATSSGELRDGEMHGHWTHRDAHGWVEAGPYVGAKRHGHWTMRFEDFGGVTEGPYVDGKMHGHWTSTDADGNVWQEGPHVNGEKHGRWIHRADDRLYYECWLEGSERFGEAGPDVPCP